MRVICAVLWPPAASRGRCWTARLLDELLDQARACARSVESGQQQSRHPVLRVWDRQRIRDLDASTGPPATELGPAAGSDTSPVA